MTWAIFDDESSNMVAQFDSEKAARAAYEAALTQHPDQKDALVLVEMDESGSAIRVWESHDFLIRS